MVSELFIAVYFLSRDDFFIKSALYKMQFPVRPSVNRYPSFFFDGFHLNSFFPVDLHGLRAEQVLHFHSVFPFQGTIVE